MKVELNEKDYDISKISYDEIFENLYHELKLACEKVRKSIYWAHSLGLKKDLCSVKSLKLKNGEVVHCVKLCLNWNEMSGNHGNIVEVIVSPFGAKYYDIIQRIEFESETLNKAIQNLMMRKFPNSNYLKECEDYYSAQDLAK